MFHKFMEYNIKHIIILPAAMAMLSLAGCQKSDFREFTKYDSTVRYEISVAGVSDAAYTKSEDGVVESSYVLSANGAEEFCPIISCTELSSAFLDSSKSEGTVTKGALIDTTGSTKKLGEYSSIVKKFHVSAWNDGTTPVHCIPSSAASSYIEVSYNSTDDEWMTEDEYLWSSTEASKTFYAYANLPSSGASVTNATTASQTLSYTVPSAASAQTDILMGYYQGDGSTGEPAVKNGTASIHFYHPLTAVLFKVGTIAGVTSINSISIEGVYKSGTAEMTPATVAESLVANKFNWTHATGADNTMTVSQSIAGSIPASGSQLGDAFLLIPQAFESTSDARIKLNVTAGSINFDLFYPLVGKTWKAGHTNVYTVGYSIGDYTFELTDESDATKTFTNTAEASSTEVIPITSTKTVDGVATNEEWRIKSYKIGSASPVEVSSAAGFTDGGFTVVKDGENLNITALARTQAHQGSHDYWINQNPVRTDNLGWSPADWGEDGENRATASRPLDLSTFNFKTETSQPMTTANCYIIRHAGTYMFPLIYANGVVQGRNSRFYLENHRGGTSTSPFIENNYGCNVKDCEIVWQDEAKVIKDVSIVGDKLAMGEYNSSNTRYVKFTVDNETVCQNNAVIAVKDENGDIIWSWHIWTTNDPALVGNSIHMKNMAGETFGFFQLGNLGWVDSSNYPAREVYVTLEQVESGNRIDISINQPIVRGPSNGNYYQSGRKDPMCRKDNPAEGTFIKNGTGPVTRATLIKNPNTFYDSIPYDGGLSWSRYYRTLIGYDLNYLYKSPSDPSPAGYWLPEYSVFSAFTATGEKTTMQSQFNVEGSYDYGWNFLTGYGENTIYFPAAGFRNYENGEIINIGVNGIYGTSSHQSPNNGFTLYFDNGSIDPTSYVRMSSYGISARPILEWIADEL